MEEIIHAGKNAGKDGREVKYMLLVHHDEISFAERTAFERQAMLQESVQLANQLHVAGQYLSAAPLHPTAETTCVQMRDGNRLVTEGPFAETASKLAAISSWRQKISLRRSILPLEFRARGSAQSKSGMLLKSKGFLTSNVRKQTRGDKIEKTFEHGVATAGVIELHEAHWFLASLAM